MITEMKKIFWMSVKCPVIIAKARVLLLRVLVINKFVLL